MIDAIAGGFGGDRESGDEIGSAGAPRGAAPAGASMASSRAAQPSIDSNRARSTYSTPCHVFRPIAVRTGSMASHACIRRASAVRAGPRSPDGRGRASRTRTRSVTAQPSASSRPGLVQAGRERPRQPQFVVPGAARRGHVRSGRQLAHPRQRQPDHESRAIAAVQAVGQRRIGERPGQSVTRRGRHDRRLRRSPRWPRRRRPGTPRTDARGPPPGPRSPRHPGRRGRAPSGEDRSERAVDRLELEFAERLVERRHAGPAESCRELGPLAGHAIPDLAELPEDVAAVRLEGEPEAPFPQLTARSQVLKAGPGIAERHERRRVVRQSEALRRGSGERAGAIRRRP